MNQRQPSDVHHLLAAQEKFGRKVAREAAKNRDSEWADSHAPARPASETMDVVNNL
jgi:hypothetical protein